MPLVCRRIAANWGSREGFKIKDFLDRLNDLDLVLSASRLADGRIRLSQWRRPNFYENEAEIKDIWTSNLAGQDARVHRTSRAISN